MADSRKFARFAAALALAAAPIAWGSLALGLAAADWNGDALGDATAILGLGPGAAPLLRLSYACSMFGSYLLLMPLALWLRARLRADHPHFSRWYALCGLAFLGLGAAGAAILGAVWPELIRAYAAAPPAEREGYAILFRTATWIPQEGLQGVIQDAAGAAWWIGLGLLLRPAARGLALFSLVLGAALAINAAGNLLAVEALTSVGLAANLLLAPIWGIWAGLTAWRGAGNAA
ncbi:MAG TPA: hypothetical protein VD886_25900 [Herpetosiphonaceae bacterium]|nr:hypothetical protein [Herpetosiphonaceae bacterium]